MDQTTRTDSGGGEQPNRIQVVVRVRPVQPQELSDDVAVTCSPDANRLQVLLPDRLAGGAVLPGATRTGARSYEFDACLPGNTTQEELYDVCGLQELVEAALDGYCVTVFAFGQTGSGKTHTIIGPRLSRGAAPGAATTRISSAASTSSGAGGAAAGLDDVGGSGTAVPNSRTTSATGLATVGGGGGGGSIGGGTARGGGGGPPGGILVDPEDGFLTRAIAAAYRSMDERSAGGGVEFSVSASVVELYNESVTDLLALDKTKTLQVRKDSRDGFAVTGLTQVSCPSDVSAVRYMVRALQYRHTRGHKMNEYSSRSHCIMTFVFASKEAGPDGQTGAKGGIRRYGKLALVDLAGSERLKDTGNTEKGAVRETGAINKSLFTLGQVLSALSARSCGSASTFVPHRDSKLTQLLWDGLRGSGRCLMLACLGPGRSAAEESLNTLHFATMATRIKAEPVVLLDPQDQLVLDLRKTITDLRNENRQLAGALHQLSAGVDPGAVLLALPDTLRAQAAATTANGGDDGGDGGGGGGPPRTPPPQGHLQPLRPMLTSDAGTSFASDVAGAPGGGGGVYALTPSPLAHNNSSSGFAGVSGGVAPLRTSASYGSPSPVMGRAGEPASPSRSRAGGSSNSNQRFGGSSNGVAGGGGSGGGGRRPAPLSVSAYGGRSPMRAPTFPLPAAGATLLPGRRSAAGSSGKPGSGGASSSGKGSPSPRSQSIGRNGGGAATGAGGGGGGSGRPAYLTEDPGALLFGYSNALQGPPPGSSGSGGSLPSLGGGGGGGGEQARRIGALAPPPPPALSEFPELAAMEAEFQNLMSGGGGGGGGGSSGGGNAVAALRSATGGAGPGGGPIARASGAADRARRSTSEVDGGDDGGGGEGDGEDLGPKPDVRALKWAERNSWFGTDYDMTAFAYKIHDRLVEAEHVDPTSNLYYMEIERRVAEHFPEKWARLMPREALPGGSGAAAVAAVRRAAPSPGRVRPPGEAATPPRPPLQPAAQHYGAGLRVNMKDPLSSGGGGGGGGQPPARSRPPVYDSSPFEYGELPLCSSAPGTPSQQPQQQQQQLYGNPVQVPYSLGSTPMPGTPSDGVGGGGAINPFNIGALHSVAPPKGSAAASRFAPAPGGGQGMGYSPAGGGGAEGFGDPGAAERIAKEYARQRAMVVEELRRAKEEAEGERQRILARIQRAAGGSKWRS